MSHTESCRYTDDQGLADTELLGHVNLVAGRALDEDIEVGDCVTGLNERAGRGVEAAGCEAASGSESQAAGGVGVHDGNWLVCGVIQAAGRVYGGIMGIMGGSGVNCKCGCCWDGEFGLTYDTAALSLSLPLNHRRMSQSP